MFSKDMNKFLIRQNKLTFIYLLFIISLFIPFRSYHFAILLPLPFHSVMTDNSPIENRLLSSTFLVETNLNSVPSTGLNRISCSIGFALMLENSPEATNLLFT